MFQPTIKIITKEHTLHRKKGLTKTLKDKEKPKIGTTPIHIQKKN